MQRTSRASFTPHVLCSHVSSLCKQSHHVLTIWFLNQSFHVMWHVSSLCNQNHHALTAVLQPKYSCNAIIWYIHNVTPKLQKQSCANSFVCISEHVLVQKKGLFYGCLLAMIQTCIGFTLTSKVCPPKKKTSAQTCTVFFFRAFSHRCFGLCLASRVVPQEAVAPTVNSHQTITFGIVGFVIFPFINRSGHVNTSRFSRIHIWEYLHACMNNIHLSTCILNIFLIISIHVGTVKICKYVSTTIYHSNLYTWKLGFQIGTEVPSYHQNSKTKPLLRWELIL